MRAILIIYRDVLKVYLPMLSAQVAVADKRAEYRPCPDALA